MDNSESGQTLKVKSDLNLSNIDIDDLPKEILFPDELNRYLRDQIQYLKYENGMIKKNYQDQEAILRESQKKVKEYSEKLQDHKLNNNKNDFVTASQVASSKIVELTKKLREKNSEVESLKTKCSKLEAALIVNDDNIESQISSVREEKPTNELEDQIKKLQEKLTSTTNKLLETKNANIQIKNESKGIRKMLQQEVGDQFESLLNNSNSTWRGRAQVICDLVQKNNDLKEKLKGVQIKCSSSVIDSDAISKAESKLCVLSKENHEIKSNSEDLQKRLNSVKARFKMLETDHGLLKSRFNILNEQSERDKDIINNLTTQVSNARDTQNDAFRQKDKQIKKLKVENEGFLSDIQKYKCQLDNVLSLLDERNKEIEGLKTEGFQERLQNYPTVKTDDKLVGRLEAERMRLLELIEMENKRLQTERDQHANTQNQLRFEKQRAAKMEATLARMELDQNVSKTGSYSNLSSTRSQDNCYKLKDELQLALENIKALKTRIDIEKQERKADFNEFSKILKDYNQHK